MARVALAFWKDQSVSVTVLQIIAFVSLIVALVFCASTIGVFGKEYNDLKDSVDDRIDVCFLFAGNSRTSTDGKNSYCEYIVYGQSLILISIIVLIALLLMIVFIRFTIGIDLILFLIGSVISLLFSFIASIVLSNGFAQTCSNIKSVFGDLFKCSDIFKAFDNVQQKSIAFTWIETMSLCVVVGVACVILALRLKRNGYRSI